MGKFAKSKKMQFFKDELWRNYLTSGIELHLIGKPKSCVLKRRRVRVATALRFEDMGYFVGAKSEKVKKTPNF
jgi:hypothetical protein